MSNIIQKIKYIIKWNGYYFLHRQKKIKPKTIMFESFMGMSISGNPKEIYEYIKDLEEFKDYEIAFVENNENRPYEGVTYFPKYSAAYLRFISNCEYIVSNGRIGKRIKIRKNQTFIQTWHGTPLKKLVYDMEGYYIGSGDKETYLKYFSKDVSKWDILLSPNKYSTEKFRHAFRFDKKIVEGYPRNYPLTKEYTKEYINELKIKIANIDKNKKVYLYTPTFRDNQTASTSVYIHKLQLDLDRLSNQTDKVFLMRLHYLISNNLDLEKYDNIIDVSKYNDINDLYLISDVLINDYSSTMFDYAYLNRPVILYPYDLDSYEKELRGFYFDYKTLSDNICYDEDKLHEVIENNLEEKLKINFNEKIDMQRIINEIFNVANNSMF